MDASAIFGPIDALAPFVEFVLLGLVLLNAGTRLFAQRTYKTQYESDGPEAISRSLVHEISNVLLLLGAFYYLTLHLHSGTVLTIIVTGLIVTDFFEFESRKVEARQDQRLDLPKGALAAWGLTLLYVAYLSLFFVIQPVWNAIV